MSGPYYPPSSEGFQHEQTDPGSQQPGYGPPGYPPPGQYRPPGQYPAQPGPYPQYGQYPQYPQPGPYPPYGQYPPQEPRRSNRGLWITCGVIAAVVLVACIGAGIFIAVAAGGTVRNVAGVALTTASFCDDLETQNYTQAYNLLSPNMQARISGDRFVSVAQAHDQQEGNVSNCSTSSTGGGTRLSGSSATITLEVTRDSSTVTGSISLVNTNGNWRIDDIDPSLGLT